MSAIPVGRVAGIPVYVERSWGFVLALAGSAMFARVWWDGTPAAIAAAIAVCGAALFLGSVLAHEAGHAAAALRLGVPVRRVTLFLFGGYTEMVGEPERPGGDLLVAIAGPAASIVVAGALWLARMPLIGPLPGGADVLGLLAAINLAVAVFNLLPGLPLDGGRVLRATWWRLSGDRVGADRVAAGAGRAVGVLLVAGGLVAAVLAENPAALGVVAVGWFVHAAAAETLSGPFAAPVTVAMSPLRRSVAVDDVVDGLVDPPVAVVESGRVVGVVVTPPATVVSAAEVMIPLRRTDVLGASASLGSAVSRIERTGRPVVVVREDRAVGVVVPDGLAAWLDEQSESGDTR